MLLQFFGAVPQNLDANVIMQLADPPSDAWINEHVPLQHVRIKDDDASIVGLKQFFHTLHLAFQLHMTVLLDV